MPLRRTPALLALAAAACHASPPATRVPETLNTTVAFAPRCHRVAYSSNREGRFRPYVLSLGPGLEPRIVPPRVDADEDLFVRSISADCASLALVADQGGRGTYDVFLYDLETARLTNLTRTPDIDDGAPAFAPGAPLLALLSAGELRLYDRDAGRFRDTGTGGAGVQFTSLAWAPEGDRLFLEDDGGGIWEYALATGRFRSVWSAGWQGDAPRTLSSRGDRLYFTSRHETDVSQVYRLDLRTGAVTRLFPSSHDQYSPVEREDGTVLYRTSVDGSFVAVAARGGRSEVISPARGVVYDLSLDFGTPLLLWAGDAPASLYAYDPARGRTPTPLVTLQPPAVAAAPRLWRNPEGMPHVLYLPPAKPRGWIVWLHGGPHEQVSPRFNPFFDALLARGYAVAALNYPGSTGIGSRYELRNLPERIQVDRQVASIEADLRALERIHPGLRRYALVGVSYGGQLAQVLARRERGRVWSLVDFSGMLEPTAAKRVRGGGPLPPALFIRGRNDAAQETPEKRALLDAYRAAAPVEELVLADEGHFIRRRGSVARIVVDMADFLDRHADGR